MGGNLKIVVSPKEIMPTECEDQVKELVKSSYKIKADKKVYAKKEAGQVAKEIASYICRGTSGIKIPLSKNVSIVKVDTTCSNCGDRSGEAFLVNGKKLCRRCKLKMEQMK